MQSMFKIILSILFGLNHNLWDPTQGSQADMSQSKQMMFEQNGSAWQASHKVFFVRKCCGQFLNGWRPSYQLFRFSMVKEH